MTIDENKYLEWENWKKENSGAINHYHFDLEPGRGYLYANSSDVTLTFIGTPYNGDGMVTLSYSDGNPDDNMHGWNLIGNPFSTAATFNDKAFYKMNPENHSELIPADNTSVEAMEGIFVHADYDGENVTFTTRAKRATDSSEEHIVINLSDNDGVVIDRAIVRFGEGETLPKFQIRDNSTKLYIPQNGKEYAIACVGTNEVPINFKANEDGTYTITVNPESVEMNYLHLIDNMTGADIDLLASPSYTFTTKTTDYESRFKLVFAPVCEDADGDNEAFAFISNGNIIVNGNGTLQVIDIMGRVVVTRGGRIQCVPTSGMTPGVYVLRLIDGDVVQTQKIIID